MNFIYFYFLWNFPAFFNQIMSKRSLIQYQSTISEEQSHSQGHSLSGQFLKSIIYAGVDGTVNTTIIILSGISSGTNLQNLFAIVISAIIAGALDMACCDYVSAKAEIAYIKKQEDRELYEVRNMLEQQKKQIIQIYQKNYDIQDCKRLSELYSTNQQAFVNIMMLEELHLVSIKDQNYPIKCGIATFASFLIFGFITVSPYIFKMAMSNIQMEVWPFVLALCFIELVSLGFSKAVILGINRLKSIIQILSMGALATGVGYGVGLLFPEN